MGIQEILNCGTNLYKIEKEHDREIRKIISTNNDKIREREIQELSAKLNYQLTKEELKCLYQRYKNMHEEIMLKEQNRHEENKIKLYNDYDKDIRLIESNSKVQEAKINQESLKNSMIHDENIAKIKKESQNDFYLFKAQIDQNSKNFKLEKDKTEKNYKILQQDKENEKIDILKKHENEKLSMLCDYQKETENAQNLLEYNKRKDEFNFNIKKEELSIMRETKLKELDILEKLLTNPNMQNPMMMQMLMSQITPKSQVDQGNISPGPLPNKNMMDFNQLTFTKMTPQM